MGGFSWLARQPAAAGDPTHALFAAQSHSIVDNLVALFEHSRAWNCSNQEPALADINGSLNGRSANTTSPASTCNPPIIVDGHLIMPEPRYFSIPSTVVGALVLRNEALNANWLVVERRAFLPIL